MAGERADRRVRALGYALLAALSYIPLLTHASGRVVAELAGDDLCAENLLAAASASVGQVQRALHAVPEV